MRLLFVINGLGPGGAQRQMTSLACELKRRGHDVELFTYHPELSHFAVALEQAEVPIHAYAKRRRFSPGMLLALRRLIRSGGYDGVLAFLDRPAQYAELVGGLRRRPFLVVSERNVVPERRSLRTRFSLRQLHRLADHVTTNARHQQDALHRVFPWLRERTSLIENGVDLARFAPGPSVRSDASGPLRLLALGSIIARKQPLALIRALALYRAQHGALPLRVSWAGRRDHSRSGEQVFQQSEALLEREGLEEHWSWLGQRHDVAQLLRDHDALVHPGAQEGLPNAICEALASGRPVLASRVLDHPRLVADGERGYLFEPGDPAQIAAALHRLVLLPAAERARMGERCRSFAEAQLSLERFADAYEALFERLAKRRRGAE